jgi:hypothetical protein
VTLLAQLDIPHPATASHPTATAALFQKKPNLAYALLMWVIVDGDISISHRAKFCPFCAAPGTLSPVRRFFIRFFIAKDSGNQL